MQNKKVLELALEQYGTHEIAGKQHNNDIVAYFKDAGHPEVSNDETAWCAAFLNAMLARAGMPITGSLKARDFLEMGEETKEPELGDVVVLWRVAKDDWRGHCGLFIRADEQWVYMLGGNQSNTVSISKYPTYQVLGYRRLSFDVLPSDTESAIV